MYQQKEPKRSTEEGIVKKTKKQALKNKDRRQTSWGQKESKKNWREITKKVKQKRNQKATGSKSRNMEDMRGEKAEPWKTDTGSTYTPTREE